MVFLWPFTGPNGYLFGTVRNVDDGSRTFTVMVGLFAIDLISLLLNSTIVWNCCKINLLDEFCTVMQNYWYIMALKMINNIYIYFFFSDLNLGGDMTMKFDWITRNESSSTFSDMKYVWCWMRKGIVQDNPNILLCKLHNFTFVINNSIIENSIIFSNH